jgi:hypothetical protein
MAIVVQMANNIGLQCHFASLKYFLPRAFPFFADFRPEPHLLRLAQPL